MIHGETTLMHDRRSRRPVRRISVVLVTRAAAAGRVKTRLICPEISAGQAAAIHAAFMGHMRGLVEDVAAINPAAGGPHPQAAPASLIMDGLAVEWDPVLFVDPLDQPVEQFNWPGWRTVLQPPGDLGCRMKFAAAECFLKRADGAVFIGVDSVYLRAGHLHWAAVSLADCDAAMLPAHDGGYVAIGLRPAAEVLLDNIDWGTGAVAGQTRDRAAAAGLNLRTGEVLTDIDSPADMWNFMTLLQTRQDLAAKRLYSILRAIVPA